MDMLFKSKFNCELYNFCCGRLFAHQEVCLLILEDNP